MTAKRCAHVERVDASGAGGLERTGVSTPRPLLLLQLFFLIAFLAVCVVASPRRDADAVLAVTAGMFGVAAMAVQNALVQISGSQRACVPPPGIRAPGSAAWRPLRQSLARAP